MTDTATFTLRKGAPFILDAHLYEVHGLETKYAKDTGKPYPHVSVDMPALTFPAPIAKDAPPEDIKARYVAIKEMVMAQRDQYPVRGIQCNGHEVVHGEGLKDLMDAAEDQADNLVRGKPAMSTWVFKVALPELRERFKDLTGSFFFLPGRLLPRHPDHMPITGPLVADEKGEI